MTSYLILVSHHAVPCPAATSLWERSWVSMLMISFLILVSHQYHVWQPEVSGRGVCINVNDFVSHLGESSAPCTATKGLLKRC